MNYFLKEITFLFFYIFSIQNLTASDSQQTSTSFMCPICLSKKEKNLTTTPCGHTFHQACLKQWVKIKPDCPVCRFSFELSINVKFNRITRSFLWKIEEATEGKLLLHQAKSLIFVSTRPRYQIIIACKNITKIQQQNRYLSLSIQGKNSPFHIEFSSPQKSTQVKQLLSTHCP